MLNYQCILFLFIMCNGCLCDICNTCVCFIADKKPIIDCHEKHMNSNEMLNFELLTLNDRQPLYELILSRNNITMLPSDVTKNLKHLKKLDLSENLVKNIHIDIFKDLQTLEDLNYSNNLLWNFDISILRTTSLLSKLNLSHNEINNLQRSLQATITKLLILDLSYNNISDLPKDFFGSMPKLEYLDLSFNKLTSLNDDSLIYLQYLKVLRVNNNDLISLNLQELPLSLLELYAGYNSIKTIFSNESLLPFKKTFIHTLSIEHNNISYLSKNLTFLQQLQYLNISGNMLSDFPYITLNNMQVLDISYNNFLIIPKSISTQNYPILMTLNVSGNPLHDVKFYSDLNLQKLEANNIETLNNINEDTFLKLKTVSSDCINLNISNNTKLTIIHENAFQHLNICSLDLSNNYLMYLPSKLIFNKGTINRKHFINLQGNPFICNCSLQWILNDLIPLLYTTHPNLLENLRCAGPPLLTNRRMVHWYKWKGKVFCNDFSNFTEKMAIGIAISSRKIITFETSSGLLIAVGMAISLLTILTIIGILLTRKMIIKRRRVNRRF